MKKMGRNAQPIEIVKANGKKHLTKSEIEHRKKSEIKFGTKDLICPDYILDDEQALEKWAEVINLYDGVDFVSSGDNGMLARYCMTHSEYLDLLKRKKRLNDIADDSDDVEEYICNSEEFDYRIRKKLLDMVSTSSLLSIENAVNKKLDTLIKMEDRLFLNPLSKVKNVAQPKKEEEKPSKFLKFGVASG